MMLVVSLAAAKAGLSRVAMNRACSAADMVIVG